MSVHDCFNPSGFLKARIRSRYFIKDFIRDFLRTTCKYIVFGCTNLLKSIFCVFISIIIIIKKKNEISVFAFYLIKDKCKVFIKIYGAVVRWILRSRYKLAESHSDCSGNERARHAAVFSSTGPHSLQWQQTRALRRTRSFSVPGVFGTIVRFSCIAGASLRKDEFFVIFVTLHQHGYPYGTTLCKLIA